MKYLFTCGGTAGHINPALAVAAELKQLDAEAEFLFIGAGRTMEKTLIPAAGYALENVEVRGFSRSLSLTGIRSNLTLPGAIRRSRRRVNEILKEFQPDAAMGTGGYVCYPVLKAAAAAGIPTAVHESNSIPGLTTKLLMKTVNTIYTAFPDDAGNYRAARKHRVTGTPVRPELLSTDPVLARAKLGVPDGIPVVVSVWGSLGAARMNERMVDFIRKNLQEGCFYHVHAVGGGEEGLRRMREALVAAGADPDAKLMDLRVYISDMDTVLNAADAVLCRAGASTLAELTALGKAAVLVPSPNVTNHHQEKNAAHMQRRGAAQMLTEEALTGETLFSAVKELLNDEQKRKSMEENAARLGNRDAARELAEDMKKAAENRRNAR